MIDDFVKNCVDNIFEVMKKHEKFNYGFFISLNMNNSEATKNWREFITECNKNKCFVFERINYTKEDNNFINLFCELYYTKKENFSQNNSEFLIFCNNVEDFEKITKISEKLSIEKELEIIEFDCMIRDLATEEQMQKELEDKNEW